MGQDKGGVGGKGEHLSRCPVVERFEAAAQGFAVERDAALTGLGADRLKLDGMAVKRRFYRDGIETLKDVADRGVGGGASPCQPEGLVQLGAMDVDEGDDATVGVRAGNDGENGEQQDVGKFVEFAFGAPGIGNISQQLQQRGSSSISVTRQRSARL